MTFHECRVCRFSVSDDDPRVGAWERAVHRNARGEPDDNKGTLYCPMCEDETLVEKPAGETQPWRSAAIPHNTQHYHPPIYLYAIDRIGTTICLMCEIEALRGRGWQPMETCKPEPYESVLVLVKLRTRETPVAIEAFQDGLGSWCWAHGEWPHPDEALLGWMPLPPAPKGDAE